MEIDNLNLSNKNNIFERNQKEFLETLLGKTIDNAIDIGIRVVLPDFIEEQIIDIKDNLLKYGLRDGITKTIDDIVKLSKRTIDIVTGKIDNNLNKKDIFETEKILENLSLVIDFTLNKIRQNRNINDSIINTIITGKDVIIKNIEKNIEETLKRQDECINYVEEYINNWKQNFQNKDFIGMEKEYKKIKELIVNIMPIEKIINESKEIETIHNLIKNNGADFNIIQEQRELIENFNKF